MMIPTMTAGEIECEKEIDMIARKRMRVEKVQHKEEGGRGGGGGRETGAGAAGGASAV